MVEFGGHIKVVDGGFSAIGSIEDDQRVDFEISKVKIDVDRIEPNEEVYECVLFGSGDVSEESGGNNLTSWEGLGDENVEGESLGVNITDVNTTLMGEEDTVTFTLGVNTDVIFGVGGVRKEGLDNEVVQGTSNGLDLKFFERHQ